MKLIVLFSVFIFNSVLASEKKKITVAIYNYPPIGYQGQNGDFGYCFQLVKEIYEAAGYEVQHRFMTAARALAATKSGAVDAVCTVNKDLADLFDLEQAKQPNSKASLEFWVKEKSNFKYNNIESLKDKRVITINGYDYSSADKNYQEYLKKTKEVVRLSENDAMARAFRIILKNRADTVCLDAPHAKYYLRKLGLLDKFKSAGKLQNTIYGRFSVGKLNKRKSELFEIYNQGHLKLHKSGRMKQIFDSYYLSEIPLMPQ